MIEEEFQKEINPEVKKFKMPVAAIFGFIVILVILLTLFLVFNKSGTETKTPSSTALPETMFTPRPAEMKIISPLATDAAVLKIKKEIEENSNMANSIDLSESNLSFPIIDFNIGF